MCLLVLIPTTPVVRSQDSDLGSFMLLSLCTKYTTRTPGRKAAQTEFGSYPDGSFDYTRFVPTNHWSPCTSTPIAKKVRGYFFRNTRGARLENVSGRHLSSIHLTSSAGPFTIVIAVYICWREQYSSSIYSVSVSRWYKRRHKSRSN